MLEYDKSFSTTDIELCKYMNDISKIINMFLTTFLVKNSNIKQNYVSLRAVNTVDSCTHTIAALYPRFVLKVNLLRHLKQF